MKGLKKTTKKTTFVGLVGGLKKFWQKENTSYPLKQKVYFGKHPFIRLFETKIAI